jgi:hypothetical protein
MLKQTENLALTLDRSDEKKSLQFNRSDYIFILTGMIDVRFIEDMALEQSSIAACA